MGLQVSTTAWETSPPTSLPSQFLARVSALPVDAIEGLTQPELLRELDALIAIDRQIEGGRAHLSATLHDAIGVISDKAIRNRLLGIRRDLFNAKELTMEKLSAAAVLPADVRSSILDFNRLLGTRRSMEQGFRVAHQAALTEARRGVQRLLSDPSFQKGLLASSPSLFANLQKFCSRDAGAFTSRDEQIERGLLRYLTRTAMKATPFSTFCAILPGCFMDATTGDGQRARLAFDGDPTTHRSFVRLNKKLYGTLWAHLKTREAVRRVLFVDANPTLRKDGDRWCFLATQRGTEVFHRIAESDAVSFVLELARRDAYTLADLIDQLVTDPTIDATPDEATSFLDELFRIGFLRFRAVVAEQTADWDQPLCELIATVGDSHAAVVLDLLHALRSIASAFAAAEVEQRQRHLDAARSVVLSALQELGIPLGTYETEVLLYEDMTASATLAVPATDEVRSAVAVLGEYMHLTVQLAMVRLEQAKMRHFFDVTYPMAEAIPLLSFYEDYYRGHLKQHLEIEARAKAGRPKTGETAYDVANPFNLEFARLHRAACGLIADRLRARWAADPDAEEICLCRDDLMEALGRLPAGAESLSQSAFCQLSLRPDGAARIIATAGHSVGFGKFYSRFLYMLPDALRQSLARANDTLSSDWLAEICGDAHFNANLHPPLLSREISYPTGESVRGDGQLLSADIEVRRHPADPHALCLIDIRTGKRVLPVDLGFLNPRMRPPLYQLLSRFVPGGAFGLPLPETPQLRRPVNGAGHPEAKAEEPAAIRRRPRVTYEGTVVVARQRWMVPAALYPRLRAGEAADEYHLRVHRWREQHGIPREVYVVIIPKPVIPRRTAGAAEASQEAGQASHDAVDVAAGETDAEEGIMEPASDDDHDGEVPERDNAPVANGDDQARRSEVRHRNTGRAASPRRERRSRDLLKPQYIDFGNPALVLLFGRLGAGLEEFQMALVERSPESSELPASGESRFSLELLLQVDRPAPAAEPPVAEVSDRAMAHA